MSGWGVVKHPVPVLAPETAPGLLSSIALSSAQAGSSIGEVRRWR